MCPSLPCLSPAACCNQGWVRSQGPRAPSRRGRRPVSPVAVSFPADSTPGTSCTLARHSLLTFHFSSPSGGSPSRARGGWGEPPPPSAPGRLLSSLGHRQRAPGHLVWLPWRALSGDSFRSAYPGEFGITGQGAPQKGPGQDYPLRMG